MEPVDLAVFNCQVEVKEDCGVRALGDFPSEFTEFIESCLGSFSTFFHQDWHWGSTKYQVGHRCIACRGGRNGSIGGG
jgi:hypothetical protein